MSINEIDEILESIELKGGEKMQEISYAEEFLKEHIENSIDEGVVIQDALNNLSYEIEDIAFEQQKYFDKCIESAIINAFKDEMENSEIDEFAIMDFKQTKTYEELKDSYIKNLFPEVKACILEELEKQILN